MSLGMKWIISEASIEWQQRRMFFVELHSSQWLSCRILNRILIFWRVKKNISRKKSHHVSMLTIGYLLEEYEKFWFFIMCHDWLNVSGHSLLSKNLTFITGYFMVWKKIMGGFFQLKIFIYISWLFRDVCQRNVS